MKARVSALLVDERGQDLIEYALLTSAILLASVAAFGSIQGAVAGAYATFTGAANSHWVPPDPP
jgi:Flp pilus assembly pilin Flp